MQPNSLDWHGLGRRRFTRRLIALGSSLLVAGSELPLAACNRDTHAGARLMVLSITQAATLVAAAEAVIPRQAGFPSVIHAGIVARLDEELWLSDDSIQDDMCAALSVLEWLPFGYGYLVRFSALPLERRRQLLQLLMASRIETVRAIATNLRLLSMFFYFGHPSSWAAIGYDGPFQKLPPLLSEQRRHYADTVAGAKS